MGPFPHMARTHARVKVERSKTSREGPFLHDVKEIRRRAREEIMRGAVTPSYGPDRETVVRLLNEALASEIVCILRYKRHQYVASGIHARSVAEEFAEHAAEEQKHADMLAQRIIELDGEPNFNPQGLLTRSHTEYVEGKNLVDMIKEDLVAERVVIQSYTEIIRFLGTKDPTTRRMMEEINANEEEHAEDLKTLMGEISRSEELRSVQG
jgi:bacterioferritin